MHHSLRSAATATSEPSATRLPPPPSTTTFTMPLLSLSFSKPSLQRGSILLPLRLRLRPTTYYYSYYYYSYSTTARTRLLLLSLLLRTILLLSPSSTVTATIEAVPNICRRILSQLLMVPLQLLPQLRQQRPEKEKWERFGSFCPASLRTRRTSAIFSLIIDRAVSTVAMNDATVF